MPDSPPPIDRERLDEMLLATSRTFAICIPMLPGIMRDALGVGYLLLRNADTIEDAYKWPKQLRIELLDEFRGLLISRDAQAAQRFADKFGPDTELEDKDHLDLLKATPFLLSQVQQLPEPYVEAISSHIDRVITRMQTWVESHDEGNRLQLIRIKQLDDYCYAVAGIVGELITSLIRLYRPTLDRTRLLLLRSLETACGAGLQLTNIIKDVFQDHLEGRYYIPQDYLPFANGGSPEGLKPILAHAYRNLCLGKDYACALPEEEFSLRKSILVPLLLGVATLRVLLEELEALIAGTEVKITREKVAEILNLAEQVAGQNQAVDLAWQDLSGPLTELNSRGLLVGLSAT